MKNNNFWVQENYKTYPTLNKDINCDVAIIGGGLAGLMVAEKLISAGKKVCILEADRVFEGDSQKTTAMISFAHDLIYNRLIKKHGLEVAKKYLIENKNAIEEIERLIVKYDLDCHYHQADMYLFATTNKGARQLKKEHEAYQKLGQNFELTKKTELPFPVKLALKVPTQGHLHPVKFGKQLYEKLHQQGLEIFENTKVAKTMEGNTLAVGKHTVCANQFVVATHFPYINNSSLFFAKMFQSRSHNVAFKSLRKIENIYESVEMDGLEFRPIYNETKQQENIILAGGGNVRTGKYKHRSHFKMVEKQLEYSFGVGENDIVARFSAQDCTTFDMLPFVGQYSPMLQNVYVVSGFNKWGFTNSVVSANIVANLVDNKLAENIYSTDRAYLSKTPIKTIRNTAELLGDFAQLVFSTDSKKFERIKNGQGAIVRHKGKRLGVYKTEDGKYKIISAICPHLGCSLKWNKDETSWDCPCHGSRFDVDGNILNNPTMEKAKVLKKN